MVSLGSCKEIQSHLYVALDQAYTDRKHFDEAYRRNHDSVSKQRLCCKGTTEMVTSSRLSLRH